MLRYNDLSQCAKDFQAMTGLSVSLFDELAQVFEPKFVEAAVQRLSRPERQCELGGGRSQEIEIIDQVLMTVIWLRSYPKQHVLAYLFGVSESSVSRMLPWLEQAGRDTLRLPDPGRKRRRELDELLTATAKLAVVIDSFEQRVQRPQQRQTADAHFSGQQQQHTRKSQVAVEEESGDFVEVSASGPGPTADLKLLEHSRLLERLPVGVGALGDSLMGGSTNCIPRPTLPPRDANPAASPVRRKIWPSTKPSLGGAWSLNTRLASLVALKPGAKLTGILANTMLHPSLLSVAWSIVALLIAIVSALLEPSQGRSDSSLTLILNFN